MFAKFIKACKTTTKWGWWRSRYVRGHENLDVTVNTTGSIRANTCLLLGESIHTPLMKVSSIIMIGQKLSSEEYPTWGITAPLHLFCVNTTQSN